MSTKTNKQAEQKEEELKTGFYFPFCGQGFIECEVIKIVNDEAAFVCYEVSGDVVNGVSSPQKRYETGTLGHNFFLTELEALLEQNNRKTSRLETRIHSLEHRPWWKFWG